MSVNSVVITQVEQFLLSQTSQESWNNILGCLPFYLVDKGEIINLWQVPKEVYCSKENFFGAY